MKRLAVVGLACLLSACQSSHTDLLPDKPEKVADFPATKAVDLSDCVHRAAQSMPFPYVFHLNARADKLEFVITATVAPRHDDAAKASQTRTAFDDQGREHHS